MVESNDASALCVRFGLSHDALLLLPRAASRSVEKAAIFKAAIRRLTEENVQVFKDKRKLPCQDALVKARAHTYTRICLIREYQHKYRVSELTWYEVSGREVGRVQLEYEYEYSPA